MAANMIAIDSDGFPNIDSYWAYHLPLQDRTNNGAPLAKQPQGALLQPSAVELRPAAEEKRAVASRRPQQRKLVDDARQEVQHYWCNYEKEQARRAASRKAQEQEAARVAAKAAAKLKAQDEAAARAAAKIAAQAAAVQAARHAALEQAVSLSNPVPLGEAALTNNAGRSPMVPKSREMCSDARSANNPGASFACIAPTDNLNRGRAVAALSKPVLKQDSTQVADLVGRSPMSQKSRGRAASSDSASASVAASTSTTSERTASVLLGLARPAHSATVQASTTTTAAAHVCAQRGNVIQKRASVSVATQATELPEHAAAALLASRHSVQQSGDLQSSSDATSSHSSRGVPLRSTHAWGRTPIQRPNMSHNRNQRQTLVSSDSESDGSVDDASLQDDSRIFSERKRREYCSPVPTRSQRPIDSNILKPIQARIGKSTKAVQAARRDGPPPESLSWEIRTPIVPESCMNRVQHSFRRDELHNHDGSNHSFADDAYDGDTEHREGAAALRSDSISPIENRGSSDDDGNSPPSSSSDIVSNQKIYRTKHTTKAQTHRDNANDEEDEEVTHQHIDDDEEDKELTYRHSDDDEQDIDQTMYCDEDDEHANDDDLELMDPSTSQNSTSPEPLDLVQESGSDSDLSVVEDSESDISPIVRPQAQRTMPQHDQKRVRFDDNLNVQRIYQATQQELGPNSASDSDDSDDDAPPTPPAPICADTSHWGQLWPDQHDTSLETVTVKPSQPDKAEDMCFGFSFEAKKDQVVSSPAMSDGLDSRKNVSADSRGADNVSAAVTDTSSEPQTIQPPTDSQHTDDASAAGDQSSELQKIQPTEVEQPLASGYAALGEESIDQIADANSQACSQVELGDHLQGQNPSPPLQLDASGELEEVPDADMEAFHLTETVEHNQTQDPLEQGRRKSQRQKFRPLAFHLGERVHYRRGATVRKVQTISILAPKDDMPSIVKTTIRAGALPADATKAEVEAEARRVKKLTDKSKRNEVAVKTTEKQPQPQQPKQKRKRQSKQATEANESQLDRKSRSRRQNTELDVYDFPSDMPIDLQVKSSSSSTARATDIFSAAAVRQPESSAPLTHGTTPRQSKQSDRLRRLIENGDHELGQNDEAEGGSKSQQLLSDTLANDAEATFETSSSLNVSTTDTTEGTRSISDVASESELTAPSKAHIELRKGFRMSQIYLQRAGKQSSEAGTGPSSAASAAGQCLSEGTADSVDTAGAASRRASSRLTSAATTGRRQKREWWKVSSDPYDHADEVMRADSVSSQNKKTKKQNVPIPQKASDQKRQASARNKVPRSAAGRYAAAATAKASKSRS